MARGENICLLHEALKPGAKGTLSLGTLPNPLPQDVILLNWAWEQAGVLLPKRQLVQMGVLPAFLALNDGTSLPQYNFLMRTGCQWCKAGAAGECEWGGRSSEGSSVQPCSSESPGQVSLQRRKRDQSLIAMLVGYLSVPHHEISLQKVDRICGGSDGACCQAPAPCPLSAWFLPLLSAVQPTYHCQVSAVAYIILFVMKFLLPGLDNLYSNTRAYCKYFP